MSAGDKTELWHRVRPHWLLLGVLAVVATVYLPTLGFAFVYDDHWTLLGNGFLRSPGDLGLLLSPEAAEKNVPDAFRPASVTFDLLSVQLLGLHPIGQHAINVLLHVGATALVFVWLRRSGATIALATSAAAMFGVMAIHAEVVAVVSFREDSLATVLGLGALAVASTAARADGPSRSAHGLRLAAVTVLTALACGAKLNAAMLPGLWLLVAVVSPFGPRAPTRRIVSVGLAALVGVAVVFALRAYATGGLSPYGDSPRVFSNRAGLGPVLAASTQIHVGYLQQMLAPLGLDPEYVDFAAAWTDPTTVLCLGALVGSVSYASAMLLRRRRPLLVIAVLGTLLLALPTSNLAPMPNMRADRFMYLPSVPLCLGFAAGLLALGRQLRSRFATSFGGLELAPLLLVVLAQGAMARGASAVYSTDGRLWRRAVQAAPGSARAQAVYGEILINRLRRQPNPEDEPLLLVRARTACEMARRIDPLDDLSWLCTARLAAVERDWVGADAALRRAMELEGARQDRPLLALASNDLDLPGIPFSERRRRAFAHLDRASREFPYVAEVFAVRARLRHRLGDPEGAMADYAHARSLHPERWDLILAGLELQLDLGHPSAAQNAYELAEEQLRDADPIAIDAIEQRLATAHRFFDDAR